jgi:hypothetical protein
LLLSYVCLPSVLWGYLILSTCSLHVYEIIHVFSENVKTTRCSTERGRRTLTARMRVRPEPCVEKCRCQSLIWKYVQWCHIYLNEFKLFIR